MEDNWGNLMIHIFLVLLMAAITGGCATQGTYYGDTPPASRVFWKEATGDTGLLKLTRDRGLMGSICLGKFLIDGVHAVDLAPGESVTLRLSPGRHELKAGPNEVGGIFCEVTSKDMKFQSQIEFAAAANMTVEFNYGFKSSGHPYLYRP